MSKNIKKAILILLLCASTSYAFVTRYIYPAENEVYYKSTAEGAAVPGGTATGQMLFWDDVNSWTITATPAAADRISFWDNSEDVVSWLAVGTGLSITGTTLTAVETDPCFLDYFVLHPYNDANWNNAVVRLDNNQVAWNYAVTRLDANQANWNTAYSSIYWSRTGAELKPVNAGDDVNTTGAVIADGSFLSTGSTEGYTVPEGAGVRFMWIPSTYGLRAGYTEGEALADMGESSATLGYNCTGAGACTFGTGYHNQADTFCLATFGQYCDGSFGAGGSATAWVGTDPLIVCGNGSSDTVRTNCLVIYKQGNIRTTGNIGIRDNEGGGYWGILDVGLLLSADRTYTFPDFDGTVGIITAADGLVLGTTAFGGTVGKMKLLEAGANGYYTTITAATQTANANYTLPVARPTANNLALISSNADPSVMSWNDQALLTTSSPTFANITDSGLTITRIPYASTAGLLIDSANLAFSTSGLYTAKAIGIGITTPTTDTMLDIVGGTPSIRQSVERASGYVAFAMFLLNAKNTTSGLSTAFGQIGIFGNLATNPTPPSAIYLYMGSAAATAPDNAVFKINATGIGVNLTSTTVPSVACDIVGAGKFSTTVSATISVNTPLIKTDTAAPADLGITTGAAKTLVLNTAVYNNLNIAGYLLTLPASSFPGTDTFRTSTPTDTGIETYAFAVDEKVHGGFELKHDYKETTDLTFYVHYQIIAAPSGTDNVQWRLGYAMLRDGVTLTTVTTIDSADTAVDTQYRSYRTDFGAITGTNFKIGDQMMFTLTRVAADGDVFLGDCLIETAGIHYQVDTLGSRGITTK